METAPKFFKTVMHKVATLFLIAHDAVGKDI